MYDSTYLYHHGIKGQKWGVRRYQYADGGLTGAGKKRYQLGVTSGNNSHKGVKAASKKTPEQKAAQRAKTKARINMGVQVSVGLLSGYMAYKSFKWASTSGYGKYGKAATDSLLNTLDRV